MERVYVLVLEDSGDEVLCVSTDRGEVDSFAKEFLTGVGEEQSLVIQTWQYGELAEEDVLSYNENPRLYLHMRIPLRNLFWVPLLALLAYSVYLAFF